MEVRNKCLLCDGEVIFDGADNAIDIYPDIEDEDAILHYAKCRKCHAEHETVQYMTTCDEGIMKSELKLRKEMLSDDTSINRTSNDRSEDLSSEDI